MPVQDAKSSLKFLSPTLDFQSHWRPGGRNFGVPKNMGDLSFQVLAGVLRGSYGSPWFLLNSVSQTLNYANCIQTQKYLWGILKLWITECLTLYWRRDIFSLSILREILLAYYGTFRGLCTNTSQSELTIFTTRPMVSCFTATSATERSATVLAAVSVTRSRFTEAVRTTASARCSLCLLPRSCLCAARTALM